MSRSNFRSIKRVNQLVLPDGVARHRLNVGLPKPLCDQVNRMAVKYEKSAARIVTELLQAGIAATNTYIPASEPGPSHMPEMVESMDGQRLGQRNRR